MTSQTDPSATRPLVSVIIPTQNRSRLLKRSVLSVFGQTYSNVEVIVVDDKSDEDIGAELATLKAAVKPLRIVRNVRAVGAQRSRLIGAQTATGSVVALLDSDDWWAPTKVEVQVAALEARPGALVSCRSTLATNGKVVPVSPIAERERVEDFLYVRGGFLQSSTFLASRELMIEGLANNLQGCHDDPCLAMYLWGRGVPIVQLKQALVHYDDFPREDRVSTSIERVQRRLSWWKAASAGWSPEAKAGYLLRETVRGYLKIGNRTDAIKTLVSSYHPRLEKILYIKTVGAIAFGGSPRRFFTRAKAV